MPRFLQPSCWGPRTALPWGQLRHKPLNQEPPARPQQLQTEIEQLCEDQGTAKGAVYQPWMSWCLWVTSCHTSSSIQQAQGCWRAPGEEPVTSPQPTRKHPVPKLLWRITELLEQELAGHIGASSDVLLGLTHTAAGGQGCGSNAGAARSVTRSPAAHPSFLPIPRAAPLCAGLWSTPGLFARGGSKGQLCSRGEVGTMGTRGVQEKFCWTPVTWSCPEPCSPFRSTPPCPAPQPQPLPFQTR